MKYSSLLTLCALALTLLATSGCSTAEQRARFRSNANREPRIITHADRESNLHN